MQKIKLGIAEDHKQYRETIISLLSLEKNIEVIFEAENGSDLLQKLKYHQVDIILLDYQMPMLNGLETLKQVRNKYPKIKTIINTSSDVVILESEFINLGANAFLLKDEDFEILTSMINEVFIKSHPFL